MSGLPDGCRHVPTSPLSGFPDKHTCVLSMRYVACLDFQTPFVGFFGQKLPRAPTPASLAVWHRATRHSNV